LGDIFDRFFSPEGWTGALANEGALFCPVDVVEGDKELRFSAELPGMSRDDITISLEGNTLSISGEKKSEQSTGGESEGYRMIERSYGRFNRSFSLPSGVKADEIHADFKDGILSVTVPKKPEAQPQRIQIAAGPPPKT